MAEYIDKWSVINRLIDLENEFQHYKPFHGFEHAMYRKICETEIAIGKMPAADVEPVRHGRWVMTLYATTSKRGRIISNRKFACSECGYSNGRKQNNYCPNCWAKMDEVSE